MTTLLILTGPQGSGNHLFSKVFALHSAVAGWSALLDKYWIGHDQEPFADCWRDPETLLTKDFSTHEYWVTSISCPYANSGVVTIPKYQLFIDIAQLLDITVKIGIIGRDRNVLHYQQRRVRDRISLPEFELNLEYLTSQKHVFLSQELLMLYKEKYMQSISQALDFPVNTSDPRFTSLCNFDANHKYFTTAEDQPLDTTVREVSGLPRIWRPR